MQIEVSSAKDEHCAGCGRPLDRSPGSVAVVVGNKRYHIACTDEAKRAAHWLYHSNECPTCGGKGRVAKSDYHPVTKAG